MKNTPTASALRLSTLIAGLGVLGFVPAIHAADFYWGSDTTPDDTLAVNSSWQDTTHWFTDATGVTGSGAAPGASDHAIFSITSLNGTPLVPRLFANTTVNAITFRNTAALNLLGGGANRDLIIGSGGVTKDTGTSQVTLGTATSSRNVIVRFAANQTWTNASDTTLTIRNSATSAVGAGAVVVTMNAASTGNISNSGAFSDNTNSTFGIIVDSTGTGIVSIQSSSYSGGTTIRRGILQVSGGSSGVASVGTANVLLGNTTGAFDSTLRVNTVNAITTNMIVQAGNTGSNRLEFTGASGAYSGDIALNNDLTLSIRGSGGSNATISGGISGTGDLIKGQYLAGVSPANSGLLILAGANTYTGDTFVNNGAFTLADGGSMTFSLDEEGSFNQVTATAINSGSVIFAGTFNFDLTGATLEGDNSWLIVDLDMLTNASFSETFSVGGSFTYDEIEGVWTNGSGFTFSESDGVLTYAAVPEPSSFALLAGAGVLGLCASRRRRRVS